jgi:hypothetical protein
MGSKASFRENLIFQRQPDGSEQYRQIDAPTSGALAASTFLSARALLPQGRGGQDACAACCKKLLSTAVHVGLPCHEASHLHILCHGCAAVLKGMQEGLDQASVRKDGVFRMVRAYQWLLCRVPLIWLYGYFVPPWGSGCFI